MNIGTENMKRPSDILFAPLELRNVTLKNRLIRSATYEGWGDSNGMPRPGMADLYLELAHGGVGSIITGFVFVSQAGRAMQPGQCGIDTNAKIAPWQRIIERVHENSPNVQLFMQIAHTGRQTRREVTDLPVAGVSARRCTYFRERIRVLDNAGIEAIVEEFGEAAQRAREAGFDGIQVHAAHGYLIHQFLSPWTNTRKDRWANPLLFLEQVIHSVRKKCGDKFPILVKLSAEDDNMPGIRIEDTIHTVKRLEILQIDAVELSYGTMEYALNIIRGRCPVDIVLEVNPLFNRMPPFPRKLWKIFFLKRYLKRFSPFQENYNADAAERIRKETVLPVFVVGGIRSADSMVKCIEMQKLSAVSLCRPLICEPDLPKKIREGTTERSRCSNCNLCTVYCDSSQTLRCYQNRRKTDYENS